MRIIMLVLLKKDKCCIQEIKCPAWIPVLPQHANGLLSAPWSPLESKWTDLTFRILPGSLSQCGHRGGPLQKQRVEQNRATGMGITPNLKQGNPLKPLSEPGKTRRRKLPTRGSNGSYSNIMSGNTDCFNYSILCIFNIVLYDVSLRFHQPVKVIGNKICRQEFLPAPPQPWAVKKWILESWLRFSGIFDKSLQKDCKDASCLLVILVTSKRGLVVATVYFQSRSSFKKKRKT